jgi:WD40 repeat protein
MYDMNGGAFHGSRIEVGARVTVVQCTPKLPVVAVGCVDKKARLFDLTSGKKWMELDDHGDVVTAVAFHPSQSHIVTASHDGFVRVFDYRKSSSAACLQKIRAHSGRGDEAINSVLVTSDFIFTAGADGNIQCLQ